MDRDQIMEAIKNMTVLELSELVKALEEEFGVSAAAPVAVAAAPGAAGGAAAPAEEEKTEFDVVLAAAGDQKIKVIKVVRDNRPWIKRCKGSSRHAPKPVKEGVSKEEAEEIKAKLTEVGATVEIK